MKRNRSKYGAIRTGKYASKKEANRAIELKLLEQAGIITGLAEQIRYELVPKQEGERAVYYVADFIYNKDGNVIVEDCKGMVTPIYVLKRKLMLYIYGIRILET